MKAQTGFSLLEVLLVMALVAVLAMLAAMRFGGGLQRMQLRSAATDVAAQLRYARAVAIASGQPQQFVIEPATRKWQGARDRQGQLPDALHVRFQGAAQLQPDANSGAIVFFEDGASSGGRLELAVADAVWQIDVAWLSGQVHLQRQAVR